jgi:acetate kinase
MSASLGGLDLLAFTAGVGEHSPEVRRRCAEQLSYLGGAVDAARSFATTSDRDITHAGAGVQALVIAAREDLQIAGKPVDSAHASRANSGEGADAW